MTGPARADPQAAQVQALAPVVGALAGRAEQHAARVRAAAERAATATLEDARRQAARIEAESRTAGRAEAESLAATERAQARRKARGVVLRAQAEAHEELRRRVRDGVRALRTEPCYPMLLDRLADLARAVACAETAGGEPGAAQAPTLEEPAGGGVVAVAPGLRIDLSAEALADRAVELLGAEVMRLWEPLSRA